MKMSELKPLGAKARERRLDALNLREKQLKSGTKPNRGTTQQKKDKPRIPLTEKDKARIEKEIGVLNKRID